MKIIRIANFMVCFFANFQINPAFSTQPNIVFIVADDLGWNDVSFHGSKQIPTPNIDVLAFDGVILNNYYASPICTPSRGSLMTGKYAINLGLQNGVILADQPWGLPPEEKILPQYLKELGYATHGIGKWHLGFFEREYLPTERGFDSFFGSWTGYIDYYNHSHSCCDTMNGYDFHDDADPASRDYDGYYATELYTKMAKEIIMNHNYKQPLFLYVSHQAAHTANEYDPYQVPPKYFNAFINIKDSNRRQFAGMVSALDASVGQIFASLDAAGVLNHTIIVFTSDNGASVKGYMNGTGSNFPLRGAKFTLWEGGTRIPAWIWSANLRMKSRVYDDLMHITDWLPTLYDAAGGNPSELKNLNGVTQWATLLEEKSSLRQEILYNIDPETDNGAIRKQQFKLVKFRTPFQNWDEWFDQEGNEIPDGENEKYLSDTTWRMNETENEHYRYSVASRILLKNYGIDIIQKLSSPKDQKLIIDCQLTNSPKEVCTITHKVCLFDLEKDPCEYNNIAEEYPEVVEELQSLLVHYQKNALPLRNQPGDPKADPKYYNNTFIAWRSIDKQVGLDFDSNEEEMSSVSESSIASNNMFWNSKSPLQFIKHLFLLSSCFVAAVMSI